MDQLFLKVIAGSPMMDLKSEYIATAEYTILCAHTPNPSHRIKLLRSRLQTLTEATSVQNMLYIVNTCITNDLPPDDVEALVEEFVQVVLDHPTWTDFIKWVCALIHYYCTDDLTIALFLEFSVPGIAIRGIKEYPQNSQLVMSACTLLSHFDMYDITDAIPQLTGALKRHIGDKQISNIAVYALSKFTSYHGEIPDRFAQANQEFVNSGGVSLLESVLDNYLDDDEVAMYALHIAANITSSGLSKVISPDSDIAKYVSQLLNRFQSLEMPCYYVLCVFSAIPSSKYIHLESIFSLFLSTQSDKLILECIHFLTALTSTLKDKKAKLHSAGCVPRIVEVMRLYERNPSIMEAACSLVSYLSFDSDAISSEIIEMGGMHLALGAMRTFSENESLLMSACAAVSGLAFDSPAGQQIISDNEGVSVIMDAMRRGKKVRLQESCCLAIGTMCWNSSLKDEIVRLGGIDLVIKALREHYTSFSLVKNACRAVEQIAFNCEKYRDELCDKGVIPLLVRGMQRHPTFDRVQMHACIALSYLSWSNKKYASEIRQHDGYKAIVDAMRNHPNNQEVQEHACHALVGIYALASDDLSPVLVQVVSAMRRHERCPAIQEEACRAIVTLCLLSPANKDILNDLKAAEEVIKAAKNFPYAELVQQEACNALAHLTYEHKGLNRTITDLNGVHLLINAMKNHKHNWKIQLNGCAGLSALAFGNSTAQEQIFELGGIECVIYASQTFDRLRMLELGCSLLGNMAWNTNIKECVAAVATPHIINIMKKYQSSALLQKSACRAISQFSFNSEINRQLLVDSGVVSLIISSMRVHFASDKFIGHALKALTYLCWENDRVAKMIIDENIEDVLQQIVVHYVESPQVSNEAIHLCKILFRKTSSSPNSPFSVKSPAMISPLAVPFISPGSRYGMGRLVSPSSPEQERETSYHFTNANGPFRSNPREQKYRPFVTDEDCSKNNRRTRARGMPTQRSGGPRSGMGRGPTGAFYDSPNPTSDFAEDRCFSQHQFRRPVPKGTPGNDRSHSHNEHPQDDPSPALQNTH